MFDSASQIWRQCFSLLCEGLYKYLGRNDISVSHIISLFLTCKILRFSHSIGTRCWKHSVREPSDFSFTSLVRQDWRYFLNSDTIHDTRKVILKIRARGTNLPTPISVDFPPRWQNTYFKTVHKKNSKRIFWLKFYFE